MLHSEAMVAFTVRNFWPEHHRCPLCCHRTRNLQHSRRHSGIWKPHWDRRVCTPNQYCLRKEGKHQLDKLVYKLPLFSNQDKWVLFSTVSGTNLEHLMRTVTPEVAEPALAQHAHDLVTTAWTLLSVPGYAS